jgi:prepilin-type N-terminal cleavage/methylation domain-containing protein
MNFDELLNRISLSSLKGKEGDPIIGEAMRIAQTVRQIWPRGQRGVTLIELLIALMLTAIIGGALYQGLLNQSKNFVVQDQVGEAMQHCRTGTDQMLRDLRMAGYSMAYQDASDNTVNDQGIVVGTRTVINGTTVVTNNNASRGTTDGLVIRRGDSVPWTITRYKPKYNGHNQRIKITMDERLQVREGDPDYVLMISLDKKEFWSVIVLDRGLDEEYSPKKKLVVWDYTGSISSDTDGDPNNDRTGKVADYGGGTMVKFKEIAFYVETSTGIPTLMKTMNGYSSQIVARYIEDLQIAYQDNAGTWYRGGTGTTQSDPPTVNNIRNVRINVLARASTASPRSNYFQTALEDGNRHPATGADGYIRRSLTTQVKARNFGVD